MFRKKRHSYFMNDFFKQKLLVLAIVTLVACFFQVAFTWSHYGDETYAGQGSIKGDGRGYYDYLTSIFIDHDLTAQIANGRTIVKTGGKAVNKYYSGTALLMLPFFLIAFSFSSVFGGDSLSGLEIPFQISMGVAAIFYMLAGLLFVYKILAHYNIGRLTQSALVLMTAVGTNLLFYVSEEITNAHVYSFFTIAAFAFYTLRYFEKPSIKPLLLASFFFGLTVLIRPVDGLILFSLPFLAGSKNQLYGGFKFLFSKLIYPATSIGVILVFVLIQMLLYKMQTGHWIVWSYANEGFYFSNPAFFKFLFSFKRGWLIYTPFFLLLFPGLFILYKKSRFSFWSFLLFFVGVIYVLSAWWSWHYGGSFGSRPMIDFYALLIIPIGSALNTLRGLRTKAITAVFFGLCIFLNFLQSYQVNVQILPSWNLNADAYIWAIGKLDKKHSKMLGGRNDVMPYHQSTKTIYEGGWNQKDNVHWTIHHTELKEQGLHLIMNEEVEFNGVFKYTFTEATKDRVFVDYQLERKEYTENEATNAYVVIDVKDSSENRKYYDAFRINDRPDLPLNKWKQWSYKYDVPVSIEKNDLIAVYVWNKGLGRFNLKNPHLKLTSLK